MLLTGEIKRQLRPCGYFPGIPLCCAQGEDVRGGRAHIEEELKERVDYFKSEDKLLEAQRISERTNFDIEMMRETGFCSGIENYSRHLTGLAPGAAALYTDRLFPG